MKSRHDRNSIVKSLIDYFVDGGLVIQYARYPGYEKPFTIKRHSPDVIAINKKTGSAYIGQCKLCTELTDQITKEQFEDFSKIVMRAGSQSESIMPFYIAVPTECESKIRETFRKFEIAWKDNIKVIGL